MVKKEFFFCKKLQFSKISQNRTKKLQSWFILFFCRKKCVEINENKFGAQKWKMFTLWRHENYQVFQFSQKSILWRHGVKNEENRKMLKNYERMLINPPFERI